jgi:BCCT family betaine/carnitine transporter
VIAILETMPLAKWIMPAFLLLSFVFLATTLDSAAYAVACVCTREMPAKGDPPRWLRMLWTCAIAGLGIGLTQVGGQDAARLSTTVGAFPLIFILVVLSLSFWRWIHRDFGEITAAKPLILPAASMARHPEERET